eukprot:4617967-Amphidinium_carterae.1
MVDKGVSSLRSLLCALHHGRCLGASVRIRGWVIAVFNTLLAYAQVPLSHAFGSVSEKRHG